MYELHCSHLDGHEQALQLNPRDIGILNNLGLLLKQLQRMPEALAAFDRAMKAHASNPSTPAPDGTMMKGLRNHGGTTVSCARTGGE